MKPSEKLRKERLKKLENLKEKGINPYPHEYDQTHLAASLQEKYSDLDDGEETSDKVSVAGRIMLFREMGKISFMTLQDSTGQIQLFFRANKLENYDVLEDLDLGDIIGVKGRMMKTKKGEVSVGVEELTVLTKSLRAPPEQYYGIKDKELRYRKRYLDLMMNPDVRDTFKKRYRIIREMQRFMDDEGFIEVETPALQPIYGGAAARPFVTRHNTLDMDMYLRISDELYLKRLIVGGFDKVYEICKDFRNEGIDTSHNPEFTMMEWYEAYGDYERGMQMFEDLISTVAEKVNGTTKVEFKGEELDFKTPWKRITIKDAIKEHAGIDVDELDDEDLRDYMKKNKIDFEKDFKKGHMVEAIFEEKCEEHMVQPTFVTDFPIETTPLCKQLRDGDEGYVERFEPYAAGMEIGNAYSELNDPVQQKKLFEEQREGDDEAHPVDNDFIEALEHGMPPTSGVGVGVDRIVMLLTESESIRDVILFPTLRPQGE